MLRKLLFNIIPSHNTMFLFAAAFPKIKEVMNTVKEEQFSDDEWQNSGNKEIIVEPTIKSQALASLSGMYASESDDDGNLNKNIVCIRVLISALFKKNYSEYNIFSNLFRIKLTNCYS